MSRLAYTATALMVLCAAVLASAQDDQVPLGDLARAARKMKPPEQREVIDNDNFRLVMDKAESARLKGQPVFSIGNAGKTFTAVSPDGACSLSFDARTIQRMAVPYVAAELPPEELLKLKGPAAIEDGMLEVAVHNSTRWDLKEIVVEVTVPDPQADSPPSKKLPDRALLYHLKGTGAPDSTTVFRVLAGPALGQLSDWHWAIVSARGIPPGTGTTSVLAPPRGPGNAGSEAESHNRPLQPGPPPEVGR